MVMPQTADAAAYILKKMRKKTANEFRIDYLINE